MTLNSHSSAFYHNNDPDDPYVDDHNRQPQQDDYYSCPACNCTEPTTNCRCSCHSQRTHH